MIELQDAPVVGVATIDDAIDDIPDMVAHLYRAWEPKPRTAFCGVSGEQDGHGKMHRAEGAKGTPWPPGTLECPICGAPICPVCLEEAILFYKWKR